MSYKALYRTYRPSSFDEVAGQRHIVKTLENSLKENKINGDEFANDLNEDWETSYNKYPYESFDDDFGKLYMEEKALDSYLAEYVRANSEYFK